MSNKKAKGKRAKTRDSHKRRGVRISVNRIRRAFKEGDTVQVVIDASFHRGMPFRRYQGRSGTVVGVQGNCYRVELQEGHSSRLLIAHPAHLKRLETASASPVALPRSGE